MSSLLDVLHKRPPRSRTAAPEPAADDALTAPAAAADPHTVELRLASEPDPAMRTLTMRHPSLPSADGAADTRETRRWSDPPPAAATPPGLAAKPAISPAARLRTGWRVPVLLALLVAVVAALGYAAYEFSVAPEESFLAAPGEAPAPPAATEVLESSEAPAPAMATPRKAKRAVTAAADSGADAANEDLAWYDQPALPSGTGTAPAIQITRGTKPDPLFDQLRDAWAALQAGDAARAEPLYREVLAADPGSVDALLGLATLAARGGRLEEARDLFRQVQRLDPKNGTAAAALSTLPGGGSAPGMESGLKGMLREQPDSAPLQFALGLRHVADQRWPDAQAAFFEAVRHDPTNADYAFNLAVALDHLGQAPAAASYYQRAIDLANGSQQFTVETARERLATLRGRQG